MSQNEQVSYREIHAYMLQKTREYYENPPAVLVDQVIREAESRGEKLSPEEAEKQVSLIDIQRCIKREMQKKWPEFMASIPQNSLKEK